MLKDVALFVLGTVAVVFAAYYTTYFIASRSQNMAQGRMIRVVDRFSLARDKTVCLLEVCGKVYLVVFSGQGVTLLDTPDPEIVAAMAESGTLQGGFANLKSSFAAMRAAKKAGPAPEETLEQSLKKAGLMHRNYDLGEDEMDDYDDYNRAEQPLALEEEDGLDEVYRRMLERRAKAADQPFAQALIEAALSEKGERAS